MMFSLFEGKTEIARRFGRNSLFGRRLKLVYRDGRRGKLNTVDPLVIQARWGEGDDTDGHAKLPPYLGPLDGSP